MSHLEAMRGITASFNSLSQNCDQVDQVEGGQLRIVDQRRHHRRRQHQHLLQRMRQQVQELSHTGFTSMSTRR